MKTTAVTPSLPTMHDVSGRYPLTKRCDEVVCETFQLNTIELCAVACYWLNEILENKVFCILWGTIGGSDLRIRQYAAERLELIEAILGKEEIRRIEAKNEERTRADLGDELWESFLQGQHVWRDELDQTP
jgi:hypothetical protein